ncbi:MAG: hypothetical protein CMJ46_12400 [Planctomyces sp.]|nr:hypothetical protein [Planctomyces sp.]
MKSNDNDNRPWWKRWFWRRRRITRVEFLAVIVTQFTAWSAISLRGELSKLLYPPESILRRNIWPTPNSSSGSVWTIAVTFAIIAYVVYVLWLWVAARNVYQFVGGKHSRLPRRLLAISLLPPLSALLSPWYLSLLYRESLMKTGVEPRSPWEIVPYVGRRYVAFVVGIGVLIPIILRILSLAELPSERLAKVHVALLDAGLIASLAVAVFSAPLIILQISYLQNEKLGHRTVQCTACGECLQEVTETCPMCGATATLATGENDQ